MAKSESAVMEILRSGKVLARPGGLSILENAEQGRGSNNSYERFIFWGSGVNCD